MWSRRRRAAGIAVGLALCVTSRSSAQVRPAERPPAVDTVADSLAALADRVARTEEQLRTLRAQIAQVAREKAGTSSRAGVELSGRVLLNAFATDGRANLVDVPTIALPPLAGPDPAAVRGALGGTFRQSVLTLSLDGRPLWGGTVRGRVDADFFGGVQEGSGGRRLFPEPRLRIATASLTWAHARLAVGQDVPLVTDVTPASTAAFGLPLFASAGNLWFWLPQLRAGVRTSGRVRLALDGALVAPWTGGDIVAGDTVDRVDAAERARRPFVQGRLGLEWGEDAMAGLLAIGVHQGWFARATGELDDSRAVTAMLRAPITEWLELRGVVYRGQALRGLGGGGVSQNVAPSGAPLRDTGGWTQLLLRPAAGWQLAAGCGISDPDDAPSPVRRHNRQCEGGVTWRPGSLPLLGVSYRRVATGYAAGTRTVGHVNFVTGVEF